MTIFAANSNSVSPPALSHADRLAAQTQDMLLLAGRLLMGWIFVSSGLRKVLDVPAFVATMPRRGLPDVLGYVAPFVELLGGLLMIVGLATRYTALVMFVFMLIATFSSHRYWAAPEAQQVNQHSHFWKNIAMTGGIVLLFVTGAGRLALDRMLARR